MRTNPPQSKPVAAPISSRSRAVSRQALSVGFDELGCVPSVCGVVAAGEGRPGPQTARYRVARLRELLGDQLDDPDARFELEIALRAS